MAAPQIWRRFTCAVLAMLLLLASAASARPSLISNVLPAQGHPQFLTSRVRLAQGAACPFPCGNFFCKTGSCRCDGGATLPPDTPYDTPPPPPEEYAYPPPPPAEYPYPPPAPEEYTPPTTPQGYYPPGDSGSFPPGPEFVAPPSPPEEGAGYTPPAAGEEFSPPPTPTPASGTSVKMSDLRLAQTDCTTSCKCSSS